MNKKQSRRPAAAGAAITDPAAARCPGQGLAPENSYWAEAETLALSLSAQLEYFELLGVEALPAELFTPALPPAPQAKAAVPSPGGAETFKEAQRQLNRCPAAAGAAIADPAATHCPAPSTSPAKKFPQEEKKPVDWALEAADLEDLAARTNRCDACALAQIRQGKPFMGRGGAQPLLVVVGPTPTIFQGDRAKLLTAIMEKGLELSPAEYYVTSLVKCDPHSDQPPPEGSDQCCWPILKRQLSLLSPKAVLALGKKPAQQLTGLHKEPFGLIRPLTHRLEGLEAFIRVTYGLEDMMSDQKIKKAAWQDLVKIKHGLQKIR